MKTIINFIVKYGLLSLKFKTYRLSFFIALILFAIIELLISIFLNKNLTRMEILTFFVSIYFPLCILISYYCNSDLE